MQDFSTDQIKGYCQNDCGYSEDLNGETNDDCASMNDFNCESEHIVNKSGWLTIRMSSLEERNQEKV